MDLFRRAGEGRLSEIFGNRTVQFDKMFKTGDGVMSKIYPYLATGIMSSSIYKGYKYSYDEDPIDFIDSKPKSNWLPTAFTIPASFGINIMMTDSDILDLNFTYLFINYKFIICLLLCIYLSGVMQIQCSSHHHNFYLIQAHLQ